MSTDEHQELERLRHIEQLLLLFDLDHYDDLMWTDGHWEGFPGPGTYVRDGLRFFVNCSDTFWWATADGEDVVLPDDLAGLRQARDDSDNHLFWPILWVSRKRKMRPMIQFFNSIFDKIETKPEDTKLLMLLNQAGPERTPGDEN